MDQALDGKVALVAGDARRRPRDGGWATRAQRTSSAERSRRSPPIPSDSATTANRSQAAKAKLYGFTDLDGSRPDCWRYLVEVQEAGKPADTTGYR